MGAFAERLRRAQGAAKGGGGGGGASLDRIARKDVRVEAVTVEDEELLAALDRIGNKITASDIEESVNIGAEIIREQMVQNAKNVIRKSDPEVPEHIIKETIVKKRDRVEVSVAPDQEHFYGKFIELGAEGGPSKKPFMAPAFEEKGPEAQDAIGDDLWKKIKDARRKFA